MGEEEEKKVEEAKKGEEKAKAKGEEKAKEGKAENKDEKKKEGGGGGGGGEGKGEAAAAAVAEAATPPPLPPPPEEVVMRVYMHCEGCAKKVKRILKGFDGVEEVKTDCRSQKVVVKGRKAAEHPLKVVERVQKKTGRKVELLSPIPPPPPPKPEKKEDDELKKKEEEDKPKTEDLKEEPIVISVVLKVHMHCEPCAQEIKRTILKMKGVQSADPDLKASQVTVKGVFNPPKLVAYVYKRTGKHATVVKQDPPPPPPPEKSAAATDADAADKPKDDKKKAAAAAGSATAAAEGEKGAADLADGNEKENAEDGGGGAAPGMVVDVVKNGFYYYYPKYGVGYYPPQIFVTDNSQIFSDENPNACSVM